MLSSFVANGKLYQYIHNNLKRVQVGCASGFPFKIWLNYNKEKDGWELKSIINEHNCAWNYKIKLVTTKFLIEQYGHNKKNPN